MLYIASDHHGVALKKKLAAFCTRKGIAFQDLGPETMEPVDYPDYAKKVVVQVQKNPRARGVLICRSGIGMLIAANRFSGIRAGSARTVKEAVRGRCEDKTNILVFAAGTLRATQAKTILTKWLATPFKPVTRYIRRIRKIEEKR